jgi:RNA polymerase sigma-B factor
MMTSRPRFREALIERHLPLARRLAYRYRYSAEPMDDLVQVASLGLVKAADRWDPDRGSAFSSYAIPTILGELRRYFRDATWDVRPPRGLQDRCLLVERAWNTLLNRHGREPRITELAEHLGWSPQEVGEGLGALKCRKIQSLDAPAGIDADNECIEVGDTVGSEDGGYADAESRAALDRLLRRFDESSQAMLRLRFEHDLRQSEIGERIGCSQMQVSRVIRRSLKSLAESGELRAAA